MTEEGKKVGFVPGLALLLSALALFLIGVNAITGTPSEETLEKMMETQFNEFSHRLDLQFQHSMNQIGKLESDSNWSRISGQAVCRSDEGRDASI